MKNYNALIISFFIGLLIFSSCRKEIVTPDQSADPPCLFNCDTSKLNILWSEPLGDSLIPSVITEELILYKDLIIYPIVFSPENFNPVKARDKSTGEIVWEWRDYHPRLPYSYSDDIELIGDKLAVCAWHDMQVIDPNSGTNFWTYSTKDNGGNGYPRISTDLGKLFHVHEEEGPVSSTTHHLVASDLESPKWDTLISFEKIGDIYYHIEPPSSWISHEGDTTLTFILYRWDPSGVFKEVDFYCYNLSKDSTEFVIKDIDEIGFISPGSPPLIVDDLAYVRSSRSVTCLNLITQEIEWQHTYPLETLGDITPQYFDGKIVFTSNQSGCRAIDAKTGIPLWHNSRQGHTPAYGMVEYKGVLYYTSCSGKLHAVNLENGEELWAEHSPNHFINSGASMCFSGIALDEEEGLLYVTDQYFILCVKLP